MTKTVTLSSLQALTGAVNRKMGEGSWKSDRSGVVYVFDSLTDSLAGYVKDVALEGESILERQNTLARYLCRFAWTAVIIDGERMDVEREEIRFHGETLDGSGYVKVATWDMIAGLGFDLEGLSVAIFTHVEQTQPERTRLGFTDGSSPMATDAGSHIDAPVTTAEASESPLMTW